MHILSTTIIVISNHEIHSLFDFVFYKGINSLKPEYNSFVVFRNFIAMMDLVVVCAPN